MAPRLSVVIPAYNRAVTIGRAIASVLAQDRDDLEVVVVDDGSDDDTAARATDFGPAVRVLRQANAGPGAARNAGIAASRGELVAFLDSDDEWLPGKLAAQLAVLDADPTVGLAGAGAEYVAAGGALVKRYAPGGAGDILARLVFENLLPTSSVVVRKALLAGQPGPFRTDLPFAEDWELWLKLAARTRAFVLPGIFVRYHVTPGSAQRSLQPERFLGAYETLFDGLRADEAAGPTVDRLWPDIAANIRLLAAYELYASGAAWPARRLALSAWRLARRPKSLATLLGLMLPPEFRCRLAARR
jgi:glycosyltransferase involved in cell wall biosynthesis